MQIDATVATSIKTTSVEAMLEMHPLGWSESKLNENYMDSVKYLTSLWTIQGHVINHHRRAPCGYGACSSHRCIEPRAHTDRDVMERY